MAYTPSTLTIASWTVPISIVGTDAITSLDNSVNAIIDTDANSAKAYLNTELAKIPTYLSGEMTSIYNDLAGQVNVIAGLTSSAAELNILDGATLTTAELNLLDGVTATTAELNKVDGLTTTTTELNYVSGVTSAIQTQLDLKAPLASPALTGSPTAPTQTGGDNSTKLATTAYADGQDIGVGQTWTDVSASRVDNVTYTNTTGKPIMVAITLSQLSSTSTTNTLSVDSTPISRTYFNSSSGVVKATLTAIVPNGSTYILSTTPDTIELWQELR